MRWMFCFLFVIGGCAHAQTTAPATIDAVTITVATKPRQTFVAFGTSLTNFTGTFQKLSPENRDRVAAAVWKDLDFKILRLWLSTADYQKNGLAEFKRIYVDSGAIEYAKKHGCTTLLLAPGDVPEEFAVPKVAEDDVFTLLTDGGAIAYGKLLADFINKLNQAGVKLNATGILNEPNDRPIRFTNEQWPVVIKTLRDELDAKGLKDVQIIAPEAASGDKWAEDTFDAIRKDPQAWAAVGGVAIHTYNMGLTATLLRKSDGKPFWQTESSTTGAEDDENASLLNAASTGGRVLSDLNHGVTHWLWFIGYEQTWPPDDGVRLIRYDCEKPDGAVHYFRKYYVMQQLSAAFPPGAVVYPCASSTEKSMTFTYGRKPALLAAAAKLPDGGWSIGVQNLTSDRFAKLKGFDREQGGPEVSRTIDVTIRLLAMEGVESATFTVRRTNEKLRNDEDGKVVMKNGRVTLSVSPLELITLRSTP